MRPPRHDLARLLPCRDRPSLVTPFPAPFSTPTLDPPLTIPYPYPSAEVENTHFRVLKKMGYGPTRTDGPTDGQTLT